MSLLATFLLIGLLAILGFLCLTDRAGVAGTEYRSGWHFSSSEVAVGSIKRGHASFGYYLRRSKEVRP
jgi:hypothetical protein